MKPIKKAQQLYTDSYMRWCNELSHEENSMNAKNISQYICNEVMGYLECLEKDKEELLENYVFWLNVKDILDESSHKKLYKY